MAIWTSRPIGALAGLGLALALWIPPARAQDAPPDPRIIEAKTACATGRPDQGAEILGRLYAETNDPLFVFNQARCFQENGRAQPALNRFREFLRKTRSQPEEDRPTAAIKAAEEHIRELEEELKAATPVVVPVPVPAPVVAPAPAPAPVVAPPPAPLVPARRPEPAPEAPAAAPYVPPPAEPPSGRGGFDGAVYMGGHSYTGDYGTGIKTGFRLGTVFGGRLGRNFALGGAFTFDMIRVDKEKLGIDPAIDVTTAAGTLSIRPAFYFPSGDGELTIAPKFGYLIILQKMSFAGESADRRYSGRMYGVDLGYEFGSGGVRVGPVVSIEHHALSEVCVTPPGGSESCADISSDSSASKGTVFGFALALWF